ncbi:HK97 gp10 family phage protein [Martelella limonii]|uniref:HK97 gp10 family phage protein n=1 Tax=Martelella limonii TaxID=1647649 RepID=UPI0015808EDD|nr:HK97 gp10 family phage protein [Martelella limonii]
MAKLSFSATIRDWAKKVPEAAEAVRNESAKEVVRDMQTLDSEGGRMRYKTGFLWGSLLASTAAMPSINPSAKPSPGQKYSFDFGQVEAVIAGSDFEDTLYFGYTANYAGYREYGARGQPPDAFVRTAAQKWPQIVERNTNRVRKAFGL